MLAGSMKRTAELLPVDASASRLATDCASTTLIASGLLCDTELTRGGRIADDAGLRSPSR
jgi:hypothetical protein